MTTANPTTAFLNSEGPAGPQLPERRTLKSGTAEWQALGDTLRVGPPTRVNRRTTLTTLATLATIATITHESGPRGLGSLVTEHAQPVSERGVAEKTLCGKRPRPGFYGRWANRSSDLSDVTCGKCKGRIAKLTRRAVVAGRW